MPSRMPLLAMFLLFFASILCDAQTATCTNWKFFNLRRFTNAHGAQGINRWGTVVGYSSKGGPAYGFIRYSNGGYKTYMVPNASETFFNRRNTLGVTVGWYTDTSAPIPFPHGLVVSGSSRATVDYPGATGTMLLGVNYWGTIVRVWSTTNSAFTGSWDSFKLKNGVFTTIHYPGSYTTNATSISDKGVIVGWYEDFVFPGIHGFKLENGVCTTIDNPKGFGGTDLFDISSSGTIVGKYFHAGSDFGFIYSSGTFKDVTVPNYTVSSTVNGINGYGDITGTAYGNGSILFTAHCQ